VGQTGVEEECGDEVEVAWASSLPDAVSGSQVEASPTANSGWTPRASAAVRARSMAVVDRSMPVTSQPCSASQMASAPSPQPTSRTDRKSTRLNSSHVSISYAVFCLKKKTKPDDYL